VESADDSKSDVSSAFSDDCEPDAGNVPSTAADMTSHGERGSRYVACCNSFRFTINGCVYLHISTVMDKCLEDVSKIAPPSSATPSPIMCVGHASSPRV